MGAVRYSNQAVDIEGRTYQWAQDEFLRDMSNVVTASYDDAYYERFRAMNYTEIGRKLMRWRRHLVNCFRGSGHVLDFGCGYGELVVLDTTTDWYGFDINTQVRKRLGPVWFDSDPHFYEYSTICMFDVLEHLPNFEDVLDEIVPDTTFVVTIPCWEHWKSLQSITDWKHFRPGEHFFYTSQKAFIAFMGYKGFKWVCTTDYESFIGRQDVVTFIFRKMTPEESQ